jgi:hypothetical protein
MTEIVIHNFRDRKDSDNRDINSSFLQRGANYLSNTFSYKDDSGYKQEIHQTTN